MSQYSSLKNKLVKGDSADELKKLKDNSVDLLCTDPPYGYGFMGKSWDKMLPPKDIFEESLRVLKPGSFAFVMSAPRSDVQYRMAQMLDEVGFEVGYTPIYWTYATGFPKAMNVGKKTEKENLKGSYAGYQPKPAVEIVIVAMKPLGKKGGYVDQALDNGKGVTWLDDCRIPFEGMSDVEQKDYERVSAFGDSDQSETKDGRNLWGKKATKKVKIIKRKPREKNTVFKSSGFGVDDNAEASPLGRFAANLLVSDDVLNDGTITKSAKRSPKNNKDNPDQLLYTPKKAIYSDENTYDDEGGFSRYYSLDAWWNNRLTKLPDEVKKTFPFLVVTKAGKKEKNDGLDTKNIHPTVKPLNLMSYLVTLGSRKNDVVLDPFMGSGTTPMACVSLSRNYIGIEREDEYFKIAEARVNKLENPIKQWEQWV
jgi:site-specific DNA-methyltransferase (adenine-specific)|tara:strand:- start:210 stop:1481 length:1272 start_codon:yes stop_codon:yes gene_type:complete